MRPIKVKVEVPIYDTELWIIIDEEASRRRDEMRNLFGEQTLLGGWAALCSYDERTGTVALFFYPDRMKRGMIAHEVFHATANILRYAGVRFEPNNHEAHAYLCGWITEQVYEAWDNETELTKFVKAACRCL